MRCRDKWKLYSFFKCNSARVIYIYINCSLFRGKDRRDQRHDLAESDSVGCIFNSLMENSAGTGTKH